MKAFFLAIALAAASSFAATADTSLVLKPSSEQIKAAKPVGNKMCPVSHEAMGSMGGGKIVVYQGKAVSLCCGGCVKKFAKDPAKYTAEAENSTKSTQAKPSDTSGHEMKKM